jgi:hypothetical protein
MNIKFIATWAGIFTISLFVMNLLFCPPTSPPPDWHQSVIPNLPLPPQGATCSSNDLCWEQPLPQANSLTKIKMDETHHVWIVGWHGTILHQVDGHLQLEWSGTYQNLNNNLLISLSF